MFDVGFNELLFIGLIALVILGPKRLPEVARTLGFWIRRARNTMRDFKDEVDAEIRKETMAELKQIHEIKEQSLSEINQSLSEPSPSQPKPDPTQDRS